MHNIYGAYIEYVRLHAAGISRNMSCAVGDLYLGLFHKEDVILCDCSCIQVIVDEVLVLSILKFDSSINQLSATFAGVRDGASASVGSNIDAVSNNTVKTVI